MNKAILAVAGLSAMVSAASVLAQGNAGVSAETAARYSTATTTIGALMDNPEAKAVIDKYLPGLLSTAGMDRVRGRTLKQLQPAFQGRLKDETLTAIDADLAKVAT